jgi:hypothetical protein
VTTRRTLESKETLNYGEKRNIYTHDIDLKKLRIKNASREDFAIAIEKIQYRGY